MRSMYEPMETGRHSCQGGPRRRIENRFLLLAAVAVLALVAVPADAGAAHWFGEIRPLPAIDFNPDPDVVEVVLIAHVNQVRFTPGGPRTPVYTYNGRIPGPLIEAEVGDTLIVHFFNLLPEETTIHWHGVELPANMDGSNIAQLAVQPGGYFRYEFDLLRATMFWYHPHIRSNEQVEKGLYGPLLVDDPATDGALGLPEREHMLVLDDIRLDEDGRVAEPFPSDPIENTLTHVNGREGNTLLANGRAEAKGFIRRGVPHRLRIVNTSNTRFQRVSIPGHRMWRIGGDGGLLEEPIELPEIGQVPDGSGGTISDPDPEKGLLLTPGERADVVFTPNPGLHEVVVEWHDFPRGRHSAFFRPDGSIGLGDAEDDGARPHENLLRLRLYGHETGNGEYLPPPQLATIDPIDATGAGPIPVLFGHTPPNPAGEITFFVQMKNGMPLPFPQVTPADAPVAEVGETRIWTVNNLTGGDHNFHSHGFTFQLLETEFVDLDDPDNNFVVPAPYLEEKDTIRLPKRPGAMGRSRSITRLAVTFDDTGREGQVTAAGKVPTATESGGWVFHCHILEHVDRGMMSFLQVVDP